MIMKDKGETLTAYLKQNKSKQSGETRQDWKPELQSWVKLINKIGNK